MLKLSDKFKAFVLVGPFTVYPNQTYTEGKAHTDIDPQHPAVEDAINRGILVRVEEAKPNFYDTTAVIDKVLEDANDAKVGEERLASFDKAQATTSEELKESLTLPGTNKTLTPEEVKEEVQKGREEYQQTGGVPATNLKPQSKGSRKKKSQQP